MSETLSQQLIDAVNSVIASAAALANMVAAQNGYFCPPSATISSEAGMIAVPTLTVPIGSLIMFVNTTDGSCAANPQVQTWELVAGTTADGGVGSGVRRPADFNASTNAKILKQRS